jgi:hypothetical protein
MSTPTNNTNNIKTFMSTPTNNTNNIKTFMSTPTNNTNNKDIHEHSYKQHK